MRALLWGCRIFIFLFLLAFALRNLESVNVRLFFGTDWQAPLVIVLLVFFAGGAALGILSLLGTIFSLRRQIAKLKRSHESVQNDGQKSLQNNEQNNEQNADQKLMSRFPGI